MEVEYNLTLRDVEAFARFHLKHGPKLKPHWSARLVGIGIVLVTLTLLGFAGLSSSLPNGDGDSITGCCIGAVVGLWMTLLVLASLHKKLVIQTTVRLYDKEECHWFLAWKHLKITADGFETTNEFEQLRCSWSVVWLIDSTDEHVFFYITLNQAHIVPRRAFRDQQHFTAFIDCACRYHKGLRPRESASTDILDALPIQSTAITRPRHP